jgi:hypothetical protein
MRKFLPQSVGTIFRRPHLAYERRSPPGQYLSYPQKCCTIDVHEIRVSPSRSPSRTFPQQEGDCYRRNQTNDDYADGVKYLSNLSTESDHPHSSFGNPVSTKPLPSSENRGALGI